MRCRQVPANIDLLSVHYCICGCSDIVGGVITHFDRLCKSRDVSFHPVSVLSRQIDDCGVAPAAISQAARQFFAQERCMPAVHVGESMVAKKEEPSMQ